MLLCLLLLLLLLIISDVSAMHLLRSVDLAALCSAHKFLYLPYYGLNVLLAPGLQPAGWTFCA